jgi:hypothetical protein
LSLDVSEEVDNDDLIHEEDYDEQWDDGVLLAAPPPRPGYYQRWVRVQVNGKPDMRNLIRRKNQRYKPRAASTAPNFESTMFSDDNVIGNEEMVLMERPMKLHQAQVARKRNESKKQMAEVQQGMFREAQAQGGFGGVQYDTDTTKVHTGGGRPAPVADDPAL